MSNPKVVIIVLVVIAILFALVLVVGIGRGRDTSPDTESSAWARLLKKLYREEKLAPDEIKAGCLQGAAFQIMAGSPCEAQVGASDKQVRTAALRVALGSEVEVDYKPSPDDELGVPMRLKLKGGKEMKLQVLKKGGTLKLSCAGGAGSPPRCVVQLS